MLVWDLDSTISKHFLVVFRNWFEKQAKKNNSRSLKGPFFQARFLLQTLASIVESDLCSGFLCRKSPQLWIGTVGKLLEQQRLILVGIGLE